MADIAKSAVTVQSLQTNGILQGVQLREFISRVADQSVMINQARKLVAEGGRVIWQCLGVDEPITVWNKHATNWNTAWEPQLSTEDVVIQAASVETLLPIDRVVLPSWNIMGDNLEEYLLSVIAKAFANDLENAAINADSELTPDPYNGQPGEGMLTQFDGWFKLALTKGTVYDHGGDAVSGALFYELWQSIPAKYRRNQREWRFYVSPDVQTAFTRYLSGVAHGNTSEGFVTDTADGIVAYAAGVPLVPVPLIPQNLAGMLSQSEVSEKKFTFVILTRPENLAVVFDPQLEWEIGSYLVRRNALWIKAGFGAGYMNTEAAAVAVNVLPEPAASVQP